MGSNEKGDRWERHYRNAFNTEPGDDPKHADRVGCDPDFLGSFFAVRMPASGSGIAVEMPDLHVWLNAGDGEVIEYAFEVKAGRDRVHFGKLDAIDEYCARTGAIPGAIVHLDYEGDFVFQKGELHTTDGGNYSVTKARDAGGARTFADFVQMPFQG